MKQFRLKQATLLLVFALMATLFTACDNKKFEVSGTISDAKDSILYFENMGLNGPEVLDSVTLDAKGDFHFTGKATDAPEFYRLRIHGGLINFAVDSTETVNVKASYPTMSGKYEITGSESNKQIQELAIKQINLQNRIEMLMNDPSTGVEQVRNGVSALLEAYKNDVRKNYIFKDPRAASSYFALFQTFRLGNAESLIFDPRHSNDDVKAFAAVATSWDTFYPNAERGTNLHNIALEGMKDMRIIKNNQAREEIDASLVQYAGTLPLNLLDNKGVEQSLTSLVGKVVLLDFHVFAMDKSAQRIMSLRALYDKYHAAGFEIYQVSEDENEHFWKTQTAAIPWISVHDDGTAAATYNVQAVPTYFLIDKTGTLHKRDSQIKDLEAEIKSLL